jgi:hypothetical protein
VDAWHHFDHTYLDDGSILIIFVQLLGNPADVFTKIFPVMSTMNVTEHLLRRSSIWMNIEWRMRGGSLFLRFRVGNGYHILKTIVLRNT